jgi:hypothetical protein
VLSLDRPASPDELYLARGDEVEPFRPILTGDVFSGITIPGVLGHDLAMVISHPCNMRVGDRLRERIQMLPIVGYQEVPLEDWTTGGHARVFSLPESQLLDGPCAARFDETGMIASVELTPERRRMCLSERGILLLLQRLVYSLCRADISGQLFDKAVGHVLAEAELLQEWNETLIPARTESGEALVPALATEAAAFDEYMKTEASGATLRNQLRDPYQRAAVRRAVRAEIARRQ